MKNNNKNKIKRHEKKINKYYKKRKINKVVSELMILFKKIKKEIDIKKENRNGKRIIEEELSKNFLILLHPVAPMITQVLWEICGFKKKYKSIYKNKEQYNKEDNNKEDRKTIIIQIGGKFIKTIKVKNKKYKETKKKIKKIKRKDINKIGNEKIIKEIKKTEEQKRIETKEIMIIKDKIINIIEKE